MDLRRVRPIYDAFDARNFKVALRLATTALDKSPKDLLIKSLKALALEKLDRASEANVLANEVKAASPTDETVLATLNLVLRDLGRGMYQSHDLMLTILGKECTSLYEAAAEKQPDDANLLTSLFFALANDGEAKKAQQVPAVA